MHSYEIGQVLVVGRSLVGLSVACLLRRLASGINEGLLVVAPVYGRWLAHILCITKAEPDLIKHVLWRKNEEYPTTARCARKTKKRPADYRATEGTQIHEEMSQSIQKYPALLAMEF